MATVIKTIGEMSTEERVRVMKLEVAMPLVKQVILTTADIYNLDSTDVFELLMHVLGDYVACVSKAEHVESVKEAMREDLGCIVDYYVAQEADRNPMN